MGGERYSKDAGRRPCRNPLRELARNMLLAWLIGGAAITAAAHAWQIERFVARAAHAGPEWVRVSLPRLSAVAAEDATTRVSPLPVLRPRARARMPDFEAERRLLFLKRVARLDDPAGWIEAPARPLDLPIPRTIPALALLPDRPVGG